MEKLLIHNFKCFQNTEIPLNRLTVFAGGNGNGKSTAIQALLFLRRTIEHCSKWEKDHYEFKEINGLKVELNGAYSLALGDSSNISNRAKEEVDVRLGIQNDNGSFQVDFVIEPLQLWLEPTKVEGNEFLKDSGLFFQEFYYLNAERIGPRISQSIQFYDFPNTGFQGQFVAQLIGDTEFSYQYKVPTSRRFAGLNNPRLEQQVNAWLNYLMPGVSIFAKYETTTGTAQVRVENHFTKGESVIAPNVGFGISYVLPIIVTGLIAKEGSFMVVENPEAHLHPSAQSRIGRFLSMIAASGVKVIVETHSDHVVNGIQVAAASSIISPDLVGINFFSQDVEMTQPSVQTISINEIGELSNWPNGFFDQTQIDFAHLHKLRKK